MICQLWPNRAHVTWFAGLGRYECMVHDLPVSVDLNVWCMLWPLRIIWVYVVCLACLGWSECIYIAGFSGLSWCECIWFARLGWYECMSYDLPVSVHMSACRMFACPADMSVYCMICMRRLRCMYVVWFPCTMHFTHRHQLNLLVCSIITTGQQINYAQLLLFWGPFTNTYKLNCQYG